MPKTKLGKSLRPKKDYIKALILERIDALKLADTDVAKIMGVSRSTYYKRMRDGTDEWTLKEIKACCKAMDIELDELRGALRLY